MAGEHDDDGPAKPDPVKHVVYYPSAINGRIHKQVQEWFNQTTGVHEFIVKPYAQKELGQTLL